MKKKFGIYAVIWAVALVVFNVVSFTVALNTGYDVLVQYKDALEQGKSARTVTFETKDEQKIAHELFLLTSKPDVYKRQVMVQRPQDKKFLVKMLDESSQIRDRRILAP